MGTWQWAVRYLGVGLGVLVCAQAAWASPDYTKRTRQKCVYCHQGSWTSGKLTPAGSYFLAHNRSLKGFVGRPVPAHGETREASAGPSTSR